MVESPVDVARMYTLASWLERNEIEVPNKHKLIHKLRYDQQVGHLVNAEFVKKFYEDPNYAITDVESDDYEHDVDIQLDKWINIQTWHGQSTAGHIIEAQFDPEGRARNFRMGNISRLGGVKNDWEKDCQVMNRKLRQLPDEGFGIVLLFGRGLGFTILPEWWEEIPENKCLIKLNLTSKDPGFTNVFGEAVVYHSDNFKMMSEVKKIISVIGFNFKDENIVY